MSLAMQSACEVSGAAHVPGEGTILRLEGIAAIGRRRGATRWPSCWHARSDPRGQGLCARFGSAFATFWILPTRRDRPLWRLSVTPSDAPAHAGDTARRAWKSAISSTGPAGSSGSMCRLRRMRRRPLIRGAMRSGHATLIRAPEGVRAAVDVFQPQAPALAALSARVKDSFDPRRLFNPGRMYAGPLMQTSFTAEQLEQPRIAEANTILRKCVHCGFCTATCPTYVLLGDELDSPRGRIYLIKNMLETGGPATAETVKHIDRCLSCLSCMTTCPSGVNYMHLVDEARAHVEETYSRPLFDRAAARPCWPTPCRGRGCSAWR